MDTTKASIILIWKAGFLSYTGSLMPSLGGEELPYTLDWGLRQCLFAASSSLKGESTNL